MSTAACLIIVTVAVLGLILAALKRDLALVLCVQLAGVPRDWRRVQRTFAVAAILALLVQIVPVNIPPLSKTTASLVSKAPVPLNTAGPFLSKAVAPLDALVPPFSNIQPAFADPTVGITITKSAPAWVNQPAGLDADTEITYYFTLTNPSAYTITVSSLVTSSVPLSTTYKGSNPDPDWWLWSGAPIFELTRTITSTVSYVGRSFVAVDQPIPDGTVITHTTCCFTGTIGITPTQFCETTPITTEIRAPDFSLTESWARAACAGQRLTYTITISNPGRVITIRPFTVTGIITDPLTIYDAPGASWSGNTITWSITSDERFLEPGGSDFLTRTFAVSVPASLANGTYLTNTYTIASPEVAPTQDSWSSSGVMVGIVAGFTPVSITICTGTSVTFTNTSKGVGLSYEWDFGDGSPIVTDTDPTHVFTNATTLPITRTVTLTVTGICGTEVTTGTVTVNPATVAGFTPVSTTICTGDPVTFTNTSTGLGLSYQWDFGDGSPVVTDTDPTHVFTNTGTLPITRTVTLTATGACGTDVTTGTVTVNPATVAGFTPVSTAICTGDPVTFTNSSTGVGLSYEWNFGDGSPVVTDTDPTHVFTSAGTLPITRTVTLTATGACGTDVTTGTVTVNLSPQASFTATTPVCLGQAMTFTNTGSVGAYLWSFGDGITSTVPSPTHTYATTGTFTIWLTTTNACGSDVTSDTVTVNPLPSVSFISNSPVVLGETMYFTNTGDTGTYQWNFGDNSPIETTRHVTHTYSAIDNYVVWLTTTLPTSCWDTYSATVTVTGCEDIYELDDSRAEATMVTPPDIARHNFHDAADVDWVGFWGTAGNIYTIETLNLAAGVDTKLYFYSWDGSTLTLLDEDDDGGSGFASLITWAVTSPGWYYVQVGRFTGSYYGCDAYYDLSIDAHLSEIPSPVYLPIILKDHPLPCPSPAPAPAPPPPPPPGPCYPLVETSMTVGNDPRGVAYNSDDKVIYVANYGDGTVSVINGVTYSVTKIISGVTGAHGVAYDSDHGLVYVTKRDSNELAVIDASTNAVSQTIPVGNQPHGVAYNPTSHKIYVANYGDNTVIIIDANTDPMTTTATISGLSEPAHIAVNRVTNKVYVSNHGNGTVTVIRGTDDAVLATVSLGSSGPYGIAADTQRNLIYVVSITVPDGDAPNLVTIDGATDQVKSDQWGHVAIKKSDGSLVPLRVMAVNPYLGPSPGGGHLYITSSSGDVAGDGSHGTDQLLMSRKGWPEGFNRPNPLDVGSRPEEGVAVDLVNSRVFVTARYVNRLTVIQDTGDHGQLCVETFALDGYVIEPVPWPTLR